MRLLVATGSLLPRDQPARSSRSCGPHGQMGWPRLSPRGGGLLPVASTLSSVLRHLRNRATVSSSSSSCECAALCRATPSAHQTARAQHATHGSKRRAIARRFHFGLRGTREFQSLTRDDTLRSQHKTHSLRSQLRPHTLSATSRPPCGRQYPEGPTPESNLFLQNVRATKLHAHNAQGTRRRMPAVGSGLIR